MVVRFSSGDEAILVDRCEVGHFAGHTICCSYRFATVMSYTKTNCSNSYRPTNPSPNNETNAFQKDTVRFWSELHTVTILSTRGKKALYRVTRGQTTSVLRLHSLQYSTSSAWVFPYQLPPAVRVQYAVGPNSRGKLRSLMLIGLPV